MSSIVRFLLVSLIAGSNVLAQADVGTQAAASVDTQAAAAVDTQAAASVDTQAAAAIDTQAAAAVDTQAAAAVDTRAAASADTQAAASADNQAAAAVDSQAAAADDTQAAAAVDTQAAPTPQADGDFIKNEEHNKKKEIDTPFVKGEIKDHSKFHEQKSGSNYEKNTLEEHSDWEKTHNSIEKNESSKSLDVKKTANSRISNEESHSSSFKQITGTNCVGCRPEPKCTTCIKPSPSPIICNDCIKTCTECIPIPRPCYTCYEPEPVCLSCLIPVEVKKTCHTCVQIVPSFNPFVDIFGGLVNVKLVEKKTSYEEQLQAALQLLFNQNQNKVVIHKEVDSTFEKFIKKIQFELSLIQELALKAKRQDQIKLLLLEPKFQPLCQTLNLTPSLIGGMSVSVIGQQINAARYQLANTAEMTFGKYKSACEAQGLGFAGIQSQFNGFGKFYQKVSSSISSSSSFSSSFSSSGSSSSIFSI